MLVTDRRRCRGRRLRELLAEAVGGGVDWIQLRERDLPDPELRELVLAIRAAVPEEVAISVNARPEIAVDLGTGLHVPASWPVGERPELAPGQLYGRSAHDEGETDRALRDGADYLVAGTVYPTESKPGHPGAGPERVRRIAHRAGTVPVYAIGGVTVSRVPELLRAGAWGVAVCGAILSSGSPRRVALAFRLALRVANAP